MKDINYAEHARSPYEALVRDERSELVLESLENPLITDKQREAFEIKYLSQGGTLLYKTVGYVMGVTKERAKQLVDLAEEKIVSDLLCRVSAIGGAEKDELCEKLLCEKKKRGKKKRRGNNNST